MTTLDVMAGWRTNDEVIAEQLRLDPELRAEWERTSIGRALAIALVGYRADHDLSQRELAGRLGVSLALVAALEIGEANPSMDTVMRLSARLGVELQIQAEPVARPRADN